MNYNLYGSYKHLNNNWMSKIPSHWKINRFKIVYSYSKGKNPKSFFDKNYEGLAPYLSMEYLRNDINPTYVPIKECPLKAKSGDILLLWDGSNAGEFVVSKEGLVSSTMAKLTPNITIDKNLSKYLCKSIEPLLRELTIGMGVPHVSTTELNNILIPNIPLEEQKQIANYLDNKTSKIDITITKNKELINLLEEKRTALINQVVTKGLNPEVPMKDSGIEWIEEIPEHWEIKSLKNVVNIIMGQSPDSNDINDEKKGFLFMQGNAEFTNLYPKPSEYCTAPKKISREGDILMSVRAPVGELNISDKRYGIGRGLCSIKAIKVESRFLWYYLIKSKGDFNYYSNGSTFDAITISNLSSFPISIPPLHEQNQITSYLDKETSIIDKIIDKIKENINLLEEYKTSLIHHVVTGKIDVRGEEI